MSLHALFNNLRCYYEISYYHKTSRHYFQHFAYIKYKYIHEWGNQMKYHPYIDTWKPFKWGSITYISGSVYIHIQHILLPGVGGKKKWELPQKLLPLFNGSLGTDSTLTENVVTQSDAFILVIYFRTIYEWSKREVIMLTVRLQREHK